MQHLFKLTKLAAFIVATSFLISCDKNDDGIEEGTARVSFTHAAPDVPSLDIYVDNVKLTPTPLSYGSTSGVMGDPYLTVNSGTRNVRVTADGTSNLAQGNIPFAANGIYSVFNFDTLNATSTLKGLVLQDNLTAPAAGKAHVRFLHLSPDAGNVDIDLSKNNDTTRITGATYIGALLVQNPTLSNFTPINSGVYSIDIRAAGMAPMLLSVPFTFAAGKIYTVYARGLKAYGVGTASGLNASIIIHN